MDLRLGEHLLAPGDFLAEQFIRRCQPQRQGSGSFRLIDIRAGNGEPDGRAGFSFERDLIFQRSSSAVVLRDGRGKLAPSDWKPVSRSCGSRAALTSAYQAKRLNAGCAG